MGLDMWLEKDYYVKNWNFMGPEESHEIQITKGGKKSDIPTEKIKSITVEVMTWRKANAIHGWFVGNVQNDVDDCGRYYVDREMLVALLDIVNQVLNRRKLADTLLPVKEGFFFGSQEYGEDYWEDMEETKKVLEEELKDENNRGDYYYQSSW